MTHYMPVVNLLGSTTPATMLAAVGTTVGSVWDSYYLFFAFAAGLSVAFILIGFALSLIRGRGRTK
jgi:cytochrome c biogenesis protein CcdA